MSRSLLSKIKRFGIGLLPRNIHCYCIGAEKTGTSSIARIFKGNFRSSHEPDPSKSIKLCIDYLEGNLSAEKTRDRLRRRDKLLNLEMESSHHMVYVCSILASMFSKAKFIATIREPYTLLNSRLKWYSTPTKPGWHQYRNYFLTTNHDAYEPEEEILKENNLYSLDVFLSQYSDHYDRIEKYIPRDRLLYVKTKKINDSIGEMSSFLDVAPNLLQPAHANKNKKKVDFLSRMDETFVRKKIWENCSRLIQTHFSETLSKYNIE